MQTIEEALFIANRNYSHDLDWAVIRRPLRKRKNFVLFVMRCTTFQDGSNLIEGVCEDAINAL
jgi:hypothetical protein